MDNINEICSDLWGLIGFTLLENLFQKIEHQKEIGSTAINEISDFFIFITESSSIEAKNDNFKSTEDFIQSKIESTDDSYR